MKKIGIRKSLRIFKLGVLAALAAVGSRAQKVRIVNLTAQRSSLALPDRPSSSPMSEVCTTPADPTGACAGQ